MRRRATYSGRSTRSRNSRRTTSSSAFLLAAGVQESRYARRGRPHLKHSDARQLPADKKAAVLEAVQKIVGKGKGKGAAVKAEDLIDKTPAVIKKGVSQPEAEKYKAQLEAAGTRHRSSQRA